MHCSIETSSVIQVNQITFCLDQTHFIIYLGVTWIESMIAPRQHQTCSHLIYTQMFTGVCQVIRYKIRLFIGVHRATPIDHLLLQASGMLPLQYDSFKWECCCAKHVH